MLTLVGLLGTAQGAADPMSPPAASPATAATTESPREEEMLRERRCLKLFQAVKNTFESDELAETEVFGRGETQQYQCLVISLALEMLSTPKKGGRIVRKRFKKQQEAFQKLLGSLTTVKISHKTSIKGKQTLAQIATSREQFHASTRTEDGVILDFQGWCESEGEIQTPRMSPLFPCKHPVTQQCDCRRHFYVKHGWHGYMAQFLFDEGKLKLTDETLNLIAANSGQNLVDKRELLEERNMDDELVLAIMSSKGCWEAVQKEIPELKIEESNGDIGNNNLWQSWKDEEPPVDPFFACNPMFAEMRKENAAKASRESYAKVQTLVEHIVRNCAAIM